MAAEEAGNSARWQGKATAELRKTTAEQVWPLLEDFCNLHKWLPSIDTCRQVEGIEGEPGLVRYCASALPTPPDVCGESPSSKVVNWCHEKLTAIDPVGKCLSYEVLDNNMGLKSYRSTMKVVPLPIKGCQIEWSFLADPVEGLRCEELVAYLDISLQGMARNMEAALILMESSN